MKSISIILLLMLCSSFFAQKKSFDFQNKFSVEEIKEDIDYTEKYLTKFHPDPYRYCSKDSLHAFVTGIKAKIDTPLTEMQLRFYIKQIAAKIGCGHTDAAASKAYAKAVKKLNRPILPINAFVIDTNRIFILNNLSSDTTIKPGDEIISINNRSSSQILKTIYSVYTSDGLNETYKKQGIKNNWFKYYYSFCYGFYPSYILKTRNDSGIVSTHTIQSISSQKDTLILPVKNVSDAIYKTKTCQFSLVYDDTKIAVMDINSFKGRGWRKFMKRSFRLVKAAGIKNLVIDLRENGGGEIMDGMCLLSYLVPKITWLPFDRKPNLIPFNARLKMGPFTRISPILFSSLTPQWPKNGRLRHYFFSVPKKKLLYKGNLFVLVNGKSFSMSGVVSSYLKYKANATIIGEETGGNIKGSNAVLSSKLILPNSKIQIHVPIYHIYHNIDAENNAHGLMPDYPTHYTSEDILKGVDVDLQKVIELVN